jgi:mannose-6-phosphate isomerase-like protein (cupin superfamily)
LLEGITMLLEPRASETFGPEEVETLRITNRSTVVGECTVGVAHLKINPGESLVVPVHKSMVEVENTGDTVLEIVPEKGKQPAQWVLHPNQSTTIDPGEVDEITIGFSPEVFGECNVAINDENPTPHRFAPGDSVEVPVAKNKVIIKNTGKISLEVIVTEWRKPYGENARPGGKGNNS